MSGLRWYLSTTTGVVVEITDRINWPDIQVGAMAEPGGSWLGDLIVDDPNGDLIPLAYRRVYCNDDDAPAGAQVVGNWFITRLRIRRQGQSPVLTARTWVISMADENSLLKRRKFVGADSNRPEETDIERIRWMLTTTELNVLHPNEDFIDTANPVTLDAANLSEQGPDEILSSCMKASGKAYGVMYREDLTPHVYTLWYFNQNTSTLYSSIVSLSNVRSEVGDPPSTLVYALSQDAELDRDPGRMASGMLGKFKTNFVYIQDTDIGDAYAYVDQVASDNNTTSLAAATAEFTRQLAELSIPDDEITTTVTIKSDNLNLIMHGMRILVHATHFPNYTDDSDPTAPEYLLPGYAAAYVWCRVIERNIRQVGPTTFEMPLRLSPQKLVVTTPVFCCLTWPSNGASHNLNPDEWSNSGDNPKGGDPDYPNGTPTVGLVTKTVGSEKAWKGFTIGGTGTVDVYAESSTSSVIGPPGSTQTFNIRLNGIVVATTSVHKDTTGLIGWTPYASVSITGLAVVPGDLIDMTIVRDGLTTGFTVPAGTGTINHRMVLTGNLA